MNKFTSEYYLPPCMEIVPEISNVPEFDKDPYGPRLHVRKQERRKSNIDLRKVSGDFLEEVKQFAEKEEESQNIQIQPLQKDLDNGPRKFGQSFTNQLVDIKKLNKSIDKREAIEVNIKMQDEPLSMV